MNAFALSSIWEDHWEYQKRVLCGYSQKIAFSDEFEFEQNMFVWVDLSIGSVLERLVLKNAAECTCQRLKWTLGSRIMIIFRRFAYN